MLDIHKNIKLQLKKFIEHNKIPNILLYGDSGSGKKTILHEFISQIYNGINNKKDYIMYINCAHNKGIKFIRDELKFFSKTNIFKKENINTNIDLNNNTPLIKSVILINSDFLTIDAQSALRRLIELFSKNTRFFMVAKDKDALLDPIISRFCNIYIPNPIIKGKIVNLHQYNNYSFINSHRRKNNIIIKKKLLNVNQSNIFEYSIDLYECGCSGVEILDCIMNINKINNISQDSNIELENLFISKLLLYCNKIKNEIRSEKLFILFILNSYLMRHIISLENIDIM